MTGPTEQRRSVLLVCHYYPPHVGGIENVVRQEAEHLVRQGAEVMVLTSGDRTRTRVEAGVRITQIASWNGMERRGIPFPVLSPSVLTVAWRLARQADIIHVHDCLYISSWVSWLYSVLARTPLVLTQHVAMVAHPSWFVQAAQRAVYGLLGRALLRRAGWLFVVNSTVGQFITAHGAHPGKIRHLPNGVDTELFRPVHSVEEREKARAHYGLPSGRPLVLFVGRLVPKKGYNLLLDAADPAYDLVFVGGGAEMPAPRAGVYHLGALSPEDVAGVYRACDVFVLPSTSEGFPLTVQEAMASGLPVVTTDDPGYRPYELDRSHFLLLPRDSATIRSSLVELVADSALRARMGDYSRWYAERGFSWPDHARVLLSFYTEATRVALGTSFGRLRALGRSLIEVVLIYGLLGFVNSAAWALFRPESLSNRIAPWLPVGRDTFGVLAFVASGLAFFILQLRPSLPLWRHGIRRHQPVDALLRTLVGWPLLGWVYLSITALAHPWFSEREPTEFDTMAGDGTVTVLCFLLGAMAMCGLRVRIIRGEAVVTRG